MCFNCFYMCFDFVKNVLNTKKMRAVTGYMLVPEFLDLVQYMMGKHPNLWNLFVQYSSKTHYFRRPGKPAWV